MNAVQKALDDAAHRIPPQILYAAFVSIEYNQAPYAVSVQSLIREKVIEARVKPDCDLVGGQLVEIPLDGVPVDTYDRFQVVFRVPKSITGGRSIARAMSIQLGMGRSAAMNHTQSAMHGHSQVLDRASGIVASNSSIPLVSSSDLQLIAENTILCLGHTILPANCALSCYLENDDAMSTIRGPSIVHFSKLVELAIKAYVYNQLVIPVGQGQLVGGMELGRFRELIDTYADANELYQTFLLEDWQQVAAFSDERTRRDMLRLAAGGRW